MAMLFTMSLYHVRESEDFIVGVQEYPYLCQISSRKTLEEAIILPTHAWGSLKRIVNHQVTSGF